MDAVGKLAPVGGANAVVTGDADAGPKFVGKDTPHHALQNAYRLLEAYKHILAPFYGPDGFPTAPGPSPAEPIGARLVRLEQSVGKWMMVRVSDGSSTRVMLGLLSQVLLPQQGAKVFHLDYIREFVPMEVHQVLTQMGDDPNRHGGGFQGPIALDARPGTVGLLEAVEVGTGSGVYRAPGTHGRTGWPVDPRMFSPKELARAHAAYRAWELRDRSGGAEV